MDSGMYDIDEIRRANLRRLEKETGTPGQTAKRLGISTTQYINLRDGAKDSKTGKQRGMRKETARRLEQAAGHPPGWLDLDHSQPSGRLVFHARPLQPSVNAHAKPVHIPLLQNGASMGSGAEASDSDVFLGTLVVAEPWVKRELRPSSAGALRFIHAHGDSMVPTFADGDVLLVDTGARDATRIDGVYVLRATDLLFVKRVRRRMDGKVEVSNDNPTIKTVDVLDGQQPIDVVGRVIWVWNGRKL